MKEKQQQKPIWNRIGNLSNKCFCLPSHVLLEYVNLMMVLRGILLYMFDIAYELLVSEGLTIFSFLYTGFDFKFFLKFIKFLDSPCYWIHPIFSVMLKLIINYLKVRLIIFTIKIIRTFSAVSMLFICLNYIAIGFFYIYRFFHCQRGNLFTKK